MFISHSTILTKKQDERHKKAQKTNDIQISYEIRMINIYGYY